MPHPSIQANLDLPSMQLEVPFSRVTFSKGKFPVENILREG